MRCGSKAELVNWCGYRAILGCLIDLSIHLDHYKISPINRLVLEVSQGFLYSLYKCRDILTVLDTSGILETQPAPPEYFLLQIPVAFKLTM